MTAACYLPFLGKGFVSEDWLLIRLHRESPPWEDLVSTVTGPWLGMHVFQFYRPVAALLFGAEASLFGAWSPGYNAVHVIAHLLTTAFAMSLIWRLLRGSPSADAAGRSSRSAALATTGIAGLFFGLYPLAPNAVLFAASFATLFGALATLGSAVLYVRWRQVAGTGPARWAGRPRLLVGSIVLYAVALGCYESSFALPAWLALYELPRLGSRAGRRSAIVALLPFATLAGAYLALRNSIFDEVLGGYPDIAAQFRRADFTIVASALRSLARVASPWFGAAGGRAWEGVAAVVVIAALALWLATAARAHRLRLLGLFGLGLWWALLFQAPFSFRRVSPAEGRFWYLAAAGAAMSLAALMLRVTLARRGRAVQLTLVVVCLVLLLGRNAVLLRQHLNWMDRAADTAARIADAIFTVASERGDPVFIAGYPLYVQSSAGLNLAQIYHYGLRSSVGPPFRAEAVDAYPLPAAGRADPRRLTLAQPVYRWLAGEGRLERWSADPSRLPDLLELEGPPDGAAILPEDPSALTVHVAAPAGARARVVVVATGNASVEPIRVGDQRSVELPGEFLRFWERLSPGPQYWWIEVLAADGTVRAQSAPRRLEVLPPAA
ncbi:MAG TPA: hypothetical protein VMT85_10635 [Thermoanaerobaculia bacterium]|nr:hypothetical protein [Thermoanaerobaculia bacterium]